jgi:hypothetical protein
MNPIGGLVMANCRMAWLAAALAVGMMALDAASAAAGSDGHAATPARATEWSAQTKSPRPRVEIRPGRLYHRECVDGLHQVSRPYWGTTVVMPYMRCWWVRG